MKRILLATALLTTIIGFAQNRTYDGATNNATNVEWGSEGGEIPRIVTNGYSDGISAPGLQGLPNPRIISVTLFEQPTSIPNDRNISDYGWAFGQFIDHDITLVDDDTTEFIPIPVPLGDPFFDPFSTGTESIFMRRSKFDPLTGTSAGNPRVHVNDITAWIDASTIYGSTEDRAMWLRTFVGGKLKVSIGNLLPFNTVDSEEDGAVDATSPFMVIEGAPMPKHFVSGDIRANEQPTLASLHTMFMREHNRLCDEIVTENPGYTDEEIYQRARKMVGAYVQSIVYYEWLPALGVDPGTYTGYQDAVNPNIMNVFSAAAYRLGHTLLNDSLLRLADDGSTIPEGDINLKDAFFNPLVVKYEGGIEPVLKGMATQRQQTFDTKVVGDLRNFLFGPPGSGGLDLVSININRGRERGLPDYNTIRQDFGMAAITDFDEITSDEMVEFHLQNLYPSVDSIDPWVGMLAEDHAPNSAVGPTVKNILEHQFADLRDGDRFYFENDPMLTQADIDMIKATKMADIIRRNTNITYIQDNVFFAKSHADVVGVTDRFEEAQSLSIYPNPTEGEFVLSFDSEERGSATLNITDISGKLIANAPIELSKGTQNIPFEFGFNAANGVYLVELVGVNTNWLGKVVLK